MITLNCVEVSRKNFYPASPEATGHVGYAPSYPNFSTRVTKRFLQITKRDYGVGESSKHDVSFELTTENKFGDSPQQP